jgi:hypothetical protein
MYDVFFCCWTFRSHQIVFFCFTFSFQQNPEGKCRWNYFRYFCFIDLLIKLSNSYVSANCSHHRKIELGFIDIQHSVSQESDATVGNSDLVITLVESCIPLEGVGGFRSESSWISPSSLGMNNILSLHDFEYWANSFFSIKVVVYIKNLFSLY